MNKSILIFTLMIGGLGLTACSEKDSEQTSATHPVTSAAQNNIQLNQATPPAVEAAAPANPAPSTNYMESKPGVGNSVVHLSKVRVVGQVLSVDVVVEPSRSNVDSKNFNVLSLNIPLDQISYIDDSNSKKMGLLKDDAGVWMVSQKPSSSNSNVLSDNMYAPFPLNFKFPAPSPEAKTVSVNITNLASFDGAVISR